MLARRLPVGLDRQMAAAAAGGPRGVAGVAGQRIVAVGEILGRHGRAPRHGGALAHRLRPRRLRVVVVALRIDGVLHQRHPPFQLGIDHRALPEFLALPLEPAPPVRRAQQREVGPLRRGGRVAGAQGRQGLGRAVAVLAADLDRVGDLAVEQAVAVAVLGVVAVDALHADVDMDRGHVDRALELVGRVVGHDLARGVEQVALAVALVDGAEVPAMAVIVGELGILGLGIDVGPDLAQEVEIAPQPADGRTFRIALQDLELLGDAGLLLLLRPHQGRVGLVVPHGVAEEGVHEHVRLVHVADHALAGRDGAGELVPDRMARLVARDGRVLGLGGAPVAVRGPGPGMAWVAVVGVDDVAGAAARGAVVAGLVVGAEEPSERVVESGLGDVEHRDGDADAGAGPAIGLADVGPARLLQSLQLAQRVGQADLGELGDDVAAAALEDPERVGRRHGLPGRERVERLQHAARLHLRVDLDHALDLGRLALARIGLAQEVVLVGQDAVVVGGAAPEHGAGGHQAALTGVDDVLMTGAACLARDPVVARVDEADIFGALLVQQRVAVRRVGAARIVPGFGQGRQHMGLLGELGVMRVGVPHARRHHAGIAAMAVGAAEHHAGIAVHAGGIGGGVAGKAPCALARGLLRRLSARRWRGRRVSDVARFLAALGGECAGCRGQERRHDRQMRQPEHHRRS